MRRSADPRPAYEQDFHAWALDQAARLRAFAHSRPKEPIDWELLAEEVEEMAKRDRRTCRSFVSHILAHLLKIEHARDPLPLAHWRAEVIAFRHNLRQALSPSIELQLRESLEAMYLEAIEDAEAQMVADPTFLDRAPRRCPYVWEQVVGDWLPARVDREAIQSMAAARRRKPV
jgi:hypothetical protein